MILQIKDFIHIKMSHEIEEIYTIFKQSDNQMKLNLSIVMNDPPLLELYLLKIYRQCLDKNIRSLSEVKQWKGPIDRICLETKLKMVKEIQRYVLKQFLDLDSLYHLFLNSNEETKKNIHLLLNQPFILEHQLLQLYQQCFHSFLVEYLNEKEMFLFDLVDRPELKYIQVKYDLIDHLNEKVMKQLGLDPSLHIEDVMDQLSSKQKKIALYWSENIEAYDASMIDRFVKEISLEDMHPLLAVLGQDTSFQTCVDTKLNPLTSMIGPLLDLSDQAFTSKEELVMRIPRLRTKVIPSDLQSLISRLDCNNPIDPITLEEIQKKNYLQLKWIILLDESGSIGDCYDKESLIKAMINNVTFAPYPKRERKYYKEPLKGVWIDEDALQIIPTAKIVQIQLKGKDKIGTMFGMSRTHGAIENIYTLKKLY